MNIDYDTSDDEYLDDSFNCKNSLANNYLPWIEKYRPKSIEDVLSHTRIKDSIRHFINNKYFPHLLFYGPPGSGKTSLIMACVRELYGKNINFMVKELNASDDRGIEVVRNTIKRFVSSENVFNNIYGDKSQVSFKMVILDETDALTPDAQGILRRIIEKYSKNARFCFICNYIQNIDIAILSRCIKFRFSPLDNKSITFKIKDIIKKEKLEIDKSGINILLKKSNGDMRKILNMMQVTSMSYSKITEDNINKCLGFIDKKMVINIINTIMNNDYKTAYDIIKNTKNNFSSSINDIITEICDILCNMIINKSKEFNFTEKQIIKILNKLRKIEYNIINSTSDNIQISSIISIFKNIS